MASLAEMKLDLEEFEALLETAKRLKSQQYLTQEINQLKLDIEKAESKAASATSNGNQQKQGYQENITKYAWDQSDKFMKLYLYLDNLVSVTEDKIAFNFTTRSVLVKVQYAEKLSQLHIARLCEDIVPGESFIKKKSDYVLVMIKKVNIGKTWAWVTEREKKEKESSKKDKPKFDNPEDPGAGLTSMLKNMYDDGDDEMKRTISKAFYESQSKQKDGRDPMADL